MKNLWPIALPPLMAVALFAQTSNEPTKSHCQWFIEPLIANWPLVAVAIIAIFVAWRTLRVMRESAERQLRAYVLPDNAGILDGTMLNPPQPARAYVPGVIMLIKNSGQTLPITL
ncbi:MAG: hypothetical protein ABSE40_15895 [Candidatus Sulfotelmatobacter sp.]|jgi:hypothetical protein